MVLNEKIICPWCGKEIKRNNASRHIKKDCKNKPKDIPYVEVIDSVVIAMYGDVVNKIIEDYNNFYSLPDLKKKYGINTKLSIELLKSHGVKTRTMSESGKKITAEKIKKFYQKNYGVSNPSQIDEIKEKKKKTFIEHYGVDNVWKSEEFKEFSRNVWNSYTEDEKTKRLSGFIERHKNGTISNLEKKVLCILNDLKIDFETQYKIKKYFHKYDIRITGTNIIIEINGDFWHANPKKYSKNDVLNFSKTNHPKASDIWKKDKTNKDFAEKNHYKVIYLWEDEINNKTDIEIGKILINKINNEISNLQQN